MRRRLLLALDVAVNFLVPWILYRASRPHVDETHAIMISAGAPLVWGLLQFALNRKVDTFSLISLGGIILSLAIFALGGSPKVLLVRESLITGAIGLLFIGSALIGRPLMFEPMRGIGATAASGSSGMAARAREEIDSYADTPFFRRLMTMLTVGFGIFGITETAASVVLAFTLPTDRFLLIAPIVRYALAGLAVAWVFFFVAPAFRRAAARTREARGPT